MDGWDKFYECVLKETIRLTRQKLDRFEESLGDWLYGQLNWPSDDWEQQLELLVEHTRYYSLLIEPECIATLHALVEARVNQSGPFAVLAEGATGPIQVAVGVTVDDGTRTDATLQLAAATAAPEPQAATEDNSVELAGPGPETSSSFRQQVQDVLDLLNADVARWWRREGGIVRARAASSWTTFLLANEKVAVEDGRPIVIVDENYDAALTAAAILRGVVRFGPFRDLFQRDWIARHDVASRFRAAQQERFKEAAGTAGTIAELYVSSISSVTPSGEVVVTVEELARDGFRWEHLLIALPFMAVFRRGAKSLKIKLPGGEEVRLSGKLLERLRGVSPARRRAIMKKALKARRRKEAIAIIKRGLATERGAPPAQIKDLRRRPAVKANAERAAQGKLPPYHPRVAVREFTTAREIRFVRVYADPRFQRGSWLVRRESIQGLTPLQVKQALALQHVPKYVSDVVVPKGTRVRLSIVGAQPEWGVAERGIFQYELLERIPDSAFTKPRRL